MSTSYCEDTPENRRIFNALKARINGQAQHPRKPRNKRHRKHQKREPVIFYGFNTCKG